MTDLTTSFDAGGVSIYNVFDAARNLFYFVTDSTVKSFDPLTGTVSTLFTVEGKIGAVAMTPSGDTLLVGISQPSGDDPQGTVYRVPLATAGDTSTHAVLHFTSLYDDTGVNDIVVTPDNQIVMGLVSQWDYVRTFDAGVDGTIPNTNLNDLSLTYDAHLRASEHGRYVLIYDAINTSGPNLHVYDSQTRHIIGTRADYSDPGYGNGDTGDISEAAGKVLALGQTGIKVFDLNLNSVAELAGTPDFGYFTDAKFNVGGREVFELNGETGNLVVWDLASATVIGSIDVHPADNAGYYFGRETLSSDGRFLFLDNVFGYESIDLTARLHTNRAGSDGNDTLIGTQGMDTLSGAAGDDVVTGALGDDSLDGGDGFDLASFAGASAGVAVSLLLQDQVQMTVAGADFLTGFEGLVGGDFADSLTGDGFDNRLDGGAGNDSLVGGGGDDTYVVDSVADVVTEAAGEGTDTIESLITYTLAAAEVENLTLGGSGDIDGTGDGGANLVTGNSGANRLNGGGGADTLAGGTGNDTYVVDSGDIVVTEGFDKGTDLVESSITYSLGSNLENLTLTGAADINGIGNGLANVITGNGGNNVLNGGGGADTLMGGAGNDGYSVDNAGDVVTEQAGEGTDRVVSSVSYTLSANVENLTLKGTNDISGTGNDLHNILVGNAGANLLDGAGGADAMAGGAGDDSYGVDNLGDVVTELASGGFDTVLAYIDYTLVSPNIEAVTLTGTADLKAVGNSQANLLTGNGGNNVLDGCAGADTMAGGLGSDTYSVGSSQDVVTELADAGAADTVKTDLASYVLGANVENLVLTGTHDIQGTGNGLANLIIGNGADNLLVGGQGADTLSGGKGDDVLNGGTGADRLIGGDGNDTYLLGIGDTIIEGAGGGIDTVLTSLATTNLGPTLENVTLLGSALNANGNGLANIMIGNGLNNVLQGGNGADTIDGRAGADTINGGGGADNLHGGLGADLFVYRALADSAVSGMDFIDDMIGADKFDFRLIDANVHLIGDQAFTQVSAFGHHEGELVLSYDAGTNRTTVMLDANGDASADMAILLAGHITSTVGWLM